MIINENLDASKPSRFTPRQLFSHTKNELSKEIKARTNSINDRQSNPDNVAMLTVTSQTDKDEREARKQENIKNDQM